METFLKDLAARGCRFWLDEGTLRMSAPAGVVTPELKQTLRARKEEIIAFLAAAPAPARAATARLEPRPADAAVPLLPGQKRLLGLAASQKRGSAYNVPLALDLTGLLDVAALRTALETLETRHESLRTVFAGERQIVRTPGAWNGFTHESMPEGEEAEPWLDARLYEQAGRVFDLAAGPLWHVWLGTVSPTRHVLCLVFHHAIFDGFSWSVVLDELETFYRAAVAGAPASLPALPVQPGDVALWLEAMRRDDSFRRDMAYWEATMPRRVRETALPAAPADPAATPTTVSRQLVLPRETAARLHRRAEAANLLPAALLLAACALLIHRHTGQTGQLFCVPLTNRPKPEMENLIGYFNSVVPIHLEIDEREPRITPARAAHRLILEASSHQSTDLQDIAGLAALARTPLNRAMVSVQETRHAPFALPGLTVTTRTLRKESADFDLAFQFALTPDTLTCMLDFNGARFATQDMDAIAARLPEILEHLLESPDAPIGTLPCYGIAAEALAAILTADPRVDEAFVAGSPRTGITRAWLKLNEDLAASLDDIRAMLGAQLEPWQVPRSLVPVDGLPRTATGAVDVPRLRAIARARERAGAPRRPPVTALERTIAAVWQRVLWLNQPIGLDDRFHDLGGHSLLAVRMIAALEAEFGRPLPPRALRELTTLEAFAQAIAREEGGDLPAARQETPDAIAPDVLYRLQTYTASWQGWRSHPDALIVGRNVGGERVPLFWCLQNYNELSQLAAYMGEDQPVYGMRSGNQVMVKNQANIDRLAAYYAGEIAQIVPPGPVLVGGNCQAAQIAFQIARRLLERGYTIPLLYLHEKFIDQPYAGPVAMSFGRESDRNPYLTDDAPEKTFARAYTGPLTVDLVSGSHAQFFREPNVQDLIRVLKQRRDEHVPPPR